VRQTTPDWENSCGICRRCGFGGDLHVAGRLASDHKYLRIRDLCQELAFTVASALTISVFIIKQKARAQNSSPQPPFPIFCGWAPEERSSVYGQGLKEIRVDRRLGDSLNSTMASPRMVHKTCFACHEPAKARDFVFTRYALGRQRWSSEPTPKEKE
jgi:hypothetical protein